MSGQAARRMSALIAGFAVVATACGGGGGDDTSGDVTLRSAGAIAVDADDVATTTTTEAVAATGGAGEADDVAASSDDVPAETPTTLPQEELDPGEALFEAVGVFQSCLDAEGRHGAMSVTKSFVGTVAEILIADGVLDDTKRVSEYVPEL
ncbi:MAG: hypothetical protein EBY52_07715, partial [Actinobacteria bacterium]|nr:hypothetical protein [Actinomycetota bacterium]